MTVFGSHIPYDTVTILGMFYRPDPADRLAQDPASPPISKVNSEGAETYTLMSPSPFHMQYKSSLTDFLPHSCPQLYHL